jgi:hypothetical protein
MYGNLINLFSGKQSRPPFDLLGIWSAENFLTKGYATRWSLWEEGNLPALRKNHAD